MISRKEVNLSKRGPLKLNKELCQEGHCLTSPPPCFSVITFEFLIHFWVYIFEFKGILSLSYFIPGSCGIWVKIFEFRFLVFDCRFLDLRLLFWFLSVFWVWPLWVLWFLSWILGYFENFDGEITNLVGPYRQILTSYLTGY